MNKLKMTLLTLNAIFENNFMKVWCHKSSFIAFNVKKICKIDFLNNNILVIKYLFYFLILNIFKNKFIFACFCINREKYHFHKKISISSFWWIYTFSDVLNTIFQYLENVRLPVCDKSFLASATRELMLTFMTLYI